MSWWKVLIYIVVLPLTLGLDVILYGFLQTCPSCSNFSQFIAQEAAFSFPFIAGLTIWVTDMTMRFSHKHSQPTDRHPTNTV